MRNNVSPSLESEGKRAMELRPKIIIFICFAASTTTPSSQITILSSQTTTPTAQSIITYHGSPTIFPTNFISFISCAQIIALNSSTAITIIPVTIFSTAPPMLPPEIDIIYGIDSLVIVVLPFAPTPAVVLILPPEFCAPSRRVHDIYQQCLISIAPVYYSTYFLPFMEQHVY